MNGTPRRILILGAGMAGLAAARTLAEAGCRVTVLEANAWVGGRIRTLHMDGEVVELGAEFIHGRPPELWRLIREAGLETSAVDGANFCHENGRLCKCEEQRDAWEFLAGLESWKGADIAFADYPPLERLSPERREEIVNFVEGFNAADARQISVKALAIQQRAEEEIHSDCSYRIRDGYGRLPEFLAQKTRAAGGAIEFSTRIERVRWKRRQVEVAARVHSKPMKFTADQAVVALPLGVLQQRTVGFVPAPAQLAEVDRLRMGPVRRFTLVFRRRFWADTPSTELPKLSFLFAHEAMPPVWWTAHPAESHTLTGWIGGPRSAAFEEFSPEQLCKAACAELARVFSLRVEDLQRQLIRCASNDWQSDPLSFGAYSYVPAGALDAVTRLATPAEDTLFFAGEHTDTTGHWGTVHAAFRSGLRAAKQIIASPHP